MTSLGFYTFDKKGGLCGWFNKADAIQTGCEHFQESVEGYQEIFVSLHKGSIQYFIWKQRANIYDVICIHMVVGYTVKLGYNEQLGTGQICSL